MVDDLSEIGDLQLDWMIEAAIRTFEYLNIYFSKVEFAEYCQRCLRISGT